MKPSYLFLSLALFSIVSCGPNNSNTQNGTIESASDEVRIKGSESELPLILKLVDYFKKSTKSSIKFNVSGGGSNIGISQLENDNVWIAMSSRKLSEKEKRYLDEKKIEVGEVVVAYDALFIIANKKNPLNKITSDQLKAIYSGKIKNWKELGGDDAPVVACSRRASSGTKSFFESIALEGSKTDASVREFDNYGSLLEMVKKEKGSIGFNSLGYINEEVKYLNISLDNGKTYYDVQDAKNLTKENYPLVRPLYLIYQKKAAEKFQPFIDYIQSDSAKSVIRSAGFLL